MFLSAASSLSATATSTSTIRLAWFDANSHEDSYYIERSRASTTGFSAVATTARNQTAYNDSGLASGTTYYYRVRASAKGQLLSLLERCQCHDSIGRRCDRALGACRAHRVSEWVQPGNIAWTASTDTGGSGLRGYNVYRNGVFVRQVLAPASSTSDTGMAASTTYSYAVSAVDTAGNTSAMSATASATTPACPDSSAPSVPTGLTVSPVSCSQLNLAWVAATDTGGSASGATTSTATAPS